MTGPAATRPRPKHARVSISVDREIGKQFSFQAARTGRPLGTFANEWLATASKISSEGGTADRTVDESKVCAIFRDEEIIPLPADFVEQVVEELCKTDREKAIRTFGTLGESLARLMKIYAPDIEQLADLARSFARIAPLKKLDIESVGEDSIVLSVVGAGRRPEVTECACEFAKSILKGYGYSVTAEELGIGTIRVEARKMGESADSKPVAVPA